VPVLVGNEHRVVYVGDLDLAGGDIEGNTRRVLVREAGEREWMRVALTAEQVAEHALPVVAKTDRRFRPARVHEAVEVESLGQGVVTRIIRAVLDSLLPEPLRDVQVRRREQRDRVRAILEELGE
jgi:hypothetical protein